MGAWQSGEFDKWVGLLQGSFTKKYLLVCGKSPIRSTNRVKYIHPSYFLDQFDYWLLADWLIASFITALIGC